MIEKILLLVYSAFLVSSLIMLFSLGRVTWGEARAVHWRRLPRNPYFVLTMGLTLLGLGLIGIAILRLADGLEGYSVSGRHPIAMTIFMTMLWLATIAILWSGSIERPSGHWRLLVAATAIDLAVLAFWLYA